MAITFVAATEAGSGGSGDTLNISLPSGVQDGDLLLLFAVQSDGEDGSFEAISGFTEFVVDVW